MKPDVNCANLKSRFFKNKFISDRVTIFNFLCLYWQKVKQRLNKYAVFQVNVKIY